MLKKPLFIVAVLISTIFMFDACGSNHKPPQNATVTNLSGQDNNSNAEQKQSSEITPEMGIEKWIKAASKGDDTGMFILAMMYRINQRQEKNNLEPAFDFSKYKNNLIEKPFEHCTDFTDESKKECYVYNSKRNPNFIETIRWTIKLEKSHSIFADFFKNPKLVYQIPQKLIIPDDHCAAAWQWLEETAKRGYPDAEYLLAIVYLNGIFTDVNKEKGLHLMQQAASHGLDTAQYALAMMYELGTHIKDIPNIYDNIEENRANSALWLEKAAASGNESAQLISLLKNFDSQNDILQIPDEIDIDSKHHAWLKLLKYGDFKEICSFLYDDSTLETDYEYNKNHDLSSLDSCNNYLNENINVQNVQDISSMDASVPIPPDNPEYHSPMTEYVDAFAPDDLREAMHITRELIKRENHVLDYSIDYDLDNAWLTYSASNEQNTNSRHLRALTLAGKECRGTIDNNAFDAARSLIESGMNDNNKAKKHLQLANLYYVNAEDNKKATEHYFQATIAGNPDAKKRLWNIYQQYIINNFNNLDKFKLLDLGFTESCPKQEAANIALDKLRSYLSRHSLTNEEKETAIKWYYRYFNNIMFDKNIYKSVNNRYSFFRITHEIVILIYNNQNNLPHLKFDKSFMDDWTRLYHEIQLVSDLPDEFNNKTRYVEVGMSFSEQLEMSELENAIFNQIKLEKNKKLEDFYVISKIKIPYIKGELSRHSLDDYYFEAIDNAKTAIVAMLLAKTITPTAFIVQNLFYHLAIEILHHPDNLKLYENNSVVCKDLRYSQFGDTPYEGDDFSYQKIYRRELFFIWYLRHFPHAAEEIYNSIAKNKSMDKSWNEYLKDARKLIKSNREIRNAMDYDPRLIVQKPPKINFTNVPD